MSRGSRMRSNEVKKGIIDRFYEIDERGKEIAERSLLISMMVAIPYVLTHPEAKEGQLYLREHLAGTCSRCEDGMCELLEEQAE